MEESNKLYAIIGTLFWVGILLVTIITLFMVGAFAQVPIDQILQGYEEQNLQGCEVWQIHYAMYTPLRIELDYEFATVREPKISSNDPESDVDVFSTPTKMNIITNSTDFHTIDLFINYQNQTSSERRVDYKIYTNDGILTQEGNWHDTGTYFCKTVMFWSEPAPDFPTPEEVREQERNFFDEQLTDIQTNQDESEGFFGIALIIVLAIGIVVVLFVITNFLNQRGMLKPMNDAKALMEDETKKMENTRENLRNTVTFFEIGEIKVMDDLKKMLEGFISLVTSKAVKSGVDKLPASSLTEKEMTDYLEEKSDKGIINLTKKVKKSVSAVFTKGSKNGGMTIKEMTKEFEQRPREENQKEYEELVQLYEVSHLEDDWLVLRALHKVLMKQI